MKCQKHNREMVRETKPGWSSEEIWVCPQCAEERVRLAIKNQGEAKLEKDKTPRPSGW